MRVSANVATVGLQSALECLKDCHEAEKDISAREECGQRVRRAARAFGDSRRGIDEAVSEIQLASPVSERRARMVAPATTLSPTLAMNVHSGPKMTSTREPNLM
jgi:hypothetical protein